MLNSLFVLAIVFTMSKNSIAEKCFVGTDALREVPCERCKGLPIEILLILDDSSSIKLSYDPGSRTWPNDQFPKEIEFAKAVVTNIRDSFGTTRVGAVFFSECMAGPHPSWLTTSPSAGSYGELSCSGGTQKFTYELQPPADMIKVLDGYDNAGHWGTPLSVGYDFAREILKTSTSGQLRVVVMISDGEPTRPNTVPGDPSTPVPKWEKVERCDKNVTALKELGYTSMTIEVSSGQDAQAGRNMRRWASFPRRTWGKRVENIAALTGILGEIVDTLCFYVQSLSSTNPDDLTANCVQTGDTVVARGTNLFDMVEDLTNINSFGTALAGGVGYSFPSIYSLTMVRVQADTVTGAKLQYKDQEDSDCTSGEDWIPVPTKGGVAWTVSAVNGQYSGSTNSNNGWYLWEFSYDMSDSDGVLKQKNFPIKCVRLSDANNIKKIEVFGKGASSQKPWCRFTWKNDNSAVFFSPAEMVGTEGTQVNCPMPDTGGDKPGYYTVEVNRDGKKDGVYTSNSRQIYHDCADKDVGNNPTPKGTLPGLPGGKTFSPTTDYLSPTPRSELFPDSLATPVKAPLTLALVFIFGYFFSV